MANQSAGTILRRWFQEVWNEQRLDRIPELARPDAITHGLDEPGTRHEGLDAFHAFQGRMRETFSHIEIVMHDVIENGSMAAGRWTANVRLVASTPPDQPMSLSGMTILRVEDGKIAEGWNEWDRLGLARVLGQAG
jgi:predicted ester cyclase